MCKGYGKEITFLVIILCIGVLFFAFAKVKESVNMRAEVESALQAINIHKAWQESAQRFKEKTGEQPDQKIYRLWGEAAKNGDKSKMDKIFADVYGALDYQIPKSKIESFAHVGQNWKYFIHNDNIGGGKISTGLVSRLNDFHKDNPQETRVSDNRIDFVIGYLDSQEGDVRNIEIQCLPADKYHVKVCKKVFKELKKQNNEKVNFIFPQNKITVNDIEFETN
ncbi:hypothetical protein Emin_0080 [Elusimicrobium minutum Pei191]|uniref:Uncharacterized protein n=1 Tax=Elusimicrobium minutum (strain Pei191) TaxID=445932 RepID=B2KAV1_ELUMP|nr:hypothetical protein [Elusimicrobium minutum]ACC97647.1 hypothetical protein Emin_0080 [Elusimicrobium minutum Pei191]